MAFDWGKLFDVGASIAAPLITAGIGSKATKKAAKYTRDANVQAADLSQRNYQQTRADLEPWRAAGGKAIGQLSQLATPGAVAPGTVSNYVTNLPGYQFAKDEGEKAWQNRYSTRSGGAGGLQNAKAGKEFLRWNSGRLAGPAYQQWQNTLGRLSGTGQGATNTISQYGAGNAASRGGYGINAADARGQGQAGAASLWTGAGNNILSNLQGRGNQTAMQNYLSTLR